MDQVLKLLKGLMGQVGILADIPKPIKVFMTYFGVLVGGLLIVKFAYPKFGQAEKTFLVVVAILLAVITGGYYAWKGWKQKKQNEQFGGDLSQHSSAMPRGLSDPGQRARLDDMRKKFQSGVEKYKQRGKDLYKLPWYVIVGEPGSGKTEAVRHSNVGFPPGMQDEFQGVGGTINMNWWFTNHAVLLDTAGRLMFEDVKPGEISEWNEFLSLLKKNRPNCPINGLFLVIPSDSLIKDSADAIQKKAGKIAQQLDVIQRVLDVRFPVFVVVTKCDKINGFREFFDGLTDPQLQHQMMGWSNPEPLDVPFQPELVDKHLAQVGGRLRRRRLGLMRDPVPENPDGRRTDEVDSLYAFPHCLELLSSRLRRYLETIFIAGEWSAKPLFLRGIYFSSAMREGSALDAELAEAIGVNVDELPEGKVWERERAYFLRDLFLDKVFREKGLVTRASNTRRMLRGQQVALFTFGFLALTAFTALAWFAMGSLREGVKKQGDHWSAVSKGGWENKFWKNSIVPTRGDGSFESTLSTNSILVDGKPVTLGEFHAKLRDLTEKPLKQSSLLTSGLAEKYNKNSRRAQRIVFEAGIVRPLLEAARQKMVRDDTDPIAARYQPDALAALIQFESDILSRGTSTNFTGTVTQEGAQKFMGMLENFIASREVPVDTNLVAVMAWTYSTNDTAIGSWPPMWLRGGTNTLASNPGIKVGLENFIRGATNSVQTNQADLKQILSLRDSAVTFATTEDALFAAAAGSVDSKIAETIRLVETARTNLIEQLARISSQPVFAGVPSLTNAYHRFQSGVSNSAGAALARVSEVNSAALTLNKDYPLFKEIDSRLKAVQESLSGSVKKMLEGVDARELLALDQNRLMSNSFVTRAEIYVRTEKLLSEKPFGAGLIGLKGGPLDKFLKERFVPVTAAAETYAGPLKEKFTLTMAHLMKRVEKAQSGVFFTAYLAEARKQLDTASRFPLIRDMSRSLSMQDFMTAEKQLKYISDDLASPIFQKYSLRDRPEFPKFIDAVKEQRTIAEALLSADGTIGVCTVSLLPAADPPAPSEKWQDDWRDLQLLVNGAKTEKIRVQSTDRKLGDMPVEQKLRLKFYKNALLPNSPTNDFATEDWGPLWLIHKYKGEREKTDPNSWVVQFPTPMPDSPGTVRLKIKFERQLPELKNWPAR